MQEEVNEKVIALSIKTGKLSAEVLQKSMKFFLSQIKKQANKRQMPNGKQTLKQLMKQNAGVSNIEITKDNNRQHQRRRGKIRGGFLGKVRTALLLRPYRLYLV